MSKRVGETARPPPHPASGWPDSQRSFEKCWQSTHAGDGGVSILRRTRGSLSIYGCAATGGRAGIEQATSVQEGLREQTQEPPFADHLQLRGLVAQGQDQGYLTFEQIAATLEEVEVTKEQVSQLHA